MGYRSIAMHPGFNWFYNRQNVYRFFGFEHFYCLNYFNLETQRKGGYIAEVYTIDKLLDIWHRHLDEHPNTPLFQFTVTIQNHGPYDSLFGVSDNFHTDLHFTDNEMSQLANYFHGIRDADVQLQRLIDYFEYHNEPVVIVYFGDHQPSLFGNINDLLFPELFAPGSSESVRRLHTTPFMIWKNESAQQMIAPSTAIMPDNMVIGSNFLGGYVLELLGFNGQSAFFDYTNALRTKFPIIMEDRSLGIDGIYSIEKSDEERQPLLIYRDWQFDKIFN